MLACAPNTTIITPPEPVKEVLIKTTIIYSDKCKACGNTTSFQLVFGRNGLKYDVERIEASSEMGKKLIEDYDLFYVPASYCAYASAVFLQKTTLQQSHMLSSIILVD